MSKFKPGQLKPAGSGRVKGTPNRKTQTLQEMCEKRGIEPFEALIEIAKTALDDGLKFKAVSELCSYVYPKPKAVSVVQVTNPDGSLSPKQDSAPLLAELKELLKALPERYT